MRDVALAALLVAFITLLPGSPVAAHSFLVSTSPAQGQRLGGAPDEVVLVFSERVDPSSSSFVMRRGDGGDQVDVAAPSTSVDGLEVRVLVADLADGIYVVEWSAFSAVDGHGSAGEFAFSVGVDAPALPASVTRSSSDRLETVGSSVFFSGLSAVAGVLVLGYGTVLTNRRSRKIGTIGLLAAASTVAFLSIRAGSDGLVLLVCLEALLAAFVTIRFERLRYVSLGALVVASAMWSSRHHATAAIGIVGTVVDTTHLVSAAAWTGALTIVVVTGRLDGDNDPWWALVRRHSRVATVLVAVTVGTGIVSAWTIVPSWSSLVVSGYGRLIGVKALLFVVAVLLAVAARRVLMPRRRRPALMRVATVEAVVLVGALGVAALLVTGAPPQPVDAAAELLGPEPLVGDVSHGAGLAGQLNVWISTDDERLDVTVSSPSGPVRGTTIDVTVVADTEIDLELRPCGPGCFTTAVAWPDEQATLLVSPTAPDWEGGTVVSDVVRPPGRLAPDVLDEVLVRMRSVPTLQVTETVSSGPGSVSPPGTVTMSGEAFIATEPYAAGNVDDVRLMPGEPERLVLFLPGSQIYGELELADDRSIVSSRLVTSGHEIFHEFSYGAD